MPIDNWKKERDRLARTHERLVREWANGQIISVGKDLDAFVREKLREEQELTDGSPQETKRTGKER